MIGVVNLKLDLEAAMKLASGSRGSVRDLTESRVTCTGRETSSSQTNSDQMK